DAITLSEGFLHHHQHTGLPRTPVTVNADCQWFVRLLVNQAHYRMRNGFVIQKVNRCFVVGDNHTVPFKLPCFSFSLSRMLPERDGLRARIGWVCYSIAARRSSWSKAEAMRSISVGVRPTAAATLRQSATARPTSPAIARASVSVSSKYSATARARSRDAVPSSRSIAVVRMRGLMSVGTGLPS